MIMWVNRSGRWPYVSRETWITRYWLLRRKISAQAGMTTHCDRRVAAELLAFAQRRGGRCGAPKHLVADLQEVIFNGPDPYPYEHGAQEEGVGSK